MSQSVGEVQPVQFTVKLRAETTAPPSGLQIQLQTNQTALEAL